MDDVADRIMEKKPYILSKLNSFVRKAADLNSDKVIKASASMHAFISNYHLAFETEINPNFKISNIITSISYTNNQTILNRESITYISATSVFMCITVLLSIINQFIFNKSFYKSVDLARKNLFLHDIGLTYIFTDDFYNTQGFIATSKLIF